MKLFCKSSAGDFSPSARVVDGTLVLSLPDATTPVVWRLDLSQTKASALEVRGLENGAYALVLRTPKGEVHEIAPYEVKAGAVRALMAVSRALEAGQGHMRPLAGANDAGPAVMAHHAPRRTGRKVLVSVIGVAVIFGLLMAITRSIGPHRVPVDEVASTDSTAPTSPSGGTTVGVPQSADSFLQGQQ